MPDNDRTEAIEQQIDELSKRWIKLASTMSDEGFDPIAISESALTVATSNMLAVQGLERCVHALGLAAGGLAQLMKADAPAPAMRQ